MFKNLAETPKADIEAQQEAERQFIARRAAHAPIAGAIIGSERLSDFKPIAPALLQELERSRAEQARLKAAGESKKSTHAKRVALMTKPYAGTSKLLELCEKLTDQGEGFTSESWGIVWQMAVREASETLALTNVTLDEKSATAIANFLSINGLYVGSSANVLAVYQLLREEGYWPEVVEPVAVQTPEPEPVNPFPYNDHPRSEYAAWEREASKREQEKEMRGDFRAGAASLGIELNPNDMRRLFSACSEARLVYPWSVADVHRVGIGLFPNARTSTEQAEVDSQREDVNLSSTEYRRKHGIDLVASYDPHLTGYTRRA